MNLHPFTRRRQAFTLIEALIVVTVLLFLAALLLPAMLRPNTGRVKAVRISCVNNLKQVGLAQLVWAGDNLDRFPAQVPAAEGGAMEATLAGDPLLNFVVMSNELSTPKILFCPSVPTVNRATNFTFFTRSNLGYFISADATTTNVQTILSGDINITNGLAHHGGLLPLSTNHPAGWTSARHDRAGNILLADGSVQQVSIAGLRNSIEASEVRTNRIVLP
jgi:Type II secretory pathway, pseudopilin PulG